jgi:hypothetical protein
MQPNLFTEFAIPRRVDGVRANGRQAIVLRAKSG